MASRQWNGDCARNGEGRAAETGFRLINRSVIDAAERGLPDLQQALAELVADDRTLNDVNVATVLHRFAKMRAPLLSLEEAAFLRRNMEQWHGRSNGRTLSGVLYGMSVLPPGEDTRRMLQHCLPWVPQADSRTFGLAGALAGIFAQPYGPDVRAIAAALRAIAPEVRMEAWQLAHAFEAMQYAPDCSEVRGMIGALTPKVAELAFSNGAPLAIILRSLAPLGDSAEVRELISVVASKVEACPAMQVQEVTSAIVGIQGQENVPALRRLFAALATKLKAARDTISASELEQALGALHMLDGSLALRVLLGALASKASAVPANTAAACYWLHTLSHCAEVTAMLTFLAGKTEQEWASEAGKGKPEVGEAGSEAPSRT